MRTKVNLIFETRQGIALALKDDSQGRPNNLETYYSPDLEIEIRCSTEEREDYERVDYERDNNRELKSDVLDAEMFAHFATWLQEQGNLYLFGISTQHVPD